MFVPFKHVCVLRVKNKISYFLYNCENAQQDPTKVHLNLRIACALKPLDVANDQQYEEAYFHILIIEHFNLSLIFICRLGIDS